MDGLQLALFAFLAGLTFAGLAGSTLELLFRRPVTLGMPFVSQDRILRSLGFTLLAGPLMLVNEALAYGDMGRPPVIPGGATLVFEVELLEVKGK